MSAMPDAHAACRRPAGVQHTNVRHSSRCVRALMRGGTHVIHRTRFVRAAISKFFAGETDQDAIEI
eukprot:5157516-Pleurochrysis_carterae.AAC.4